MNDRHRSQHTPPRRKLTPEQFRALPEWQIERANRLHRQFLRVEARPKGRSVTRALKQFEYFWRGQTYRRDPSKRVHFSPSNLYRLFYRWRNGGRTPQAVALLYQPSTPRSITAADLRAYVSLAASTPDLTTFAGVCAKLPMAKGAKRPSVYAVLRALPGLLRTKLRREFYRRRVARSAARQFVRTVATFIPTLGVAR